MTTQERATARQRGTVPMDSAIRSHRASGLPTPPAGPSDGRLVPTARPWWRRSNRLRNVALFALAAVLSLIILIPIYFGLMGGLKSNAQLAAGPLALPSPWNFDNYTFILSQARFWRMVFNSAFIAIATVAFAVGAAALVAFVFARFAFRGREALFVLFAAGLMFPPAVAIPPLFVLLRELGLVNSPWGVVLPQVAGGLPLTIIILRTFFRTIPAEIEESATLDGCNTFELFWRIMLPMAKPALSVVSVLILVTSWNNFLLPLLVLQRPTWWTVPLGVMQFQGQWATDVARVLAYVMLASAPALAFFFLAERQLVAGIAPATGARG